MEPAITDVWFRSRLPLIEIARRLELQDVVEDAESVWSWVIGAFGNFRLDITRNSTRAADQVDTRIFVLDGDFHEDLIEELIGRLRRIVPGSIVCGRWEYRSGDDFDQVIIRQV